MQNNDFKSNRHAIYNLKYHLVIVTKYRHKCINNCILPELNDIFENLIQN